jgi:hypothetical protein
LNSGPVRQATRQHFTLGTLIKTLVHSPVQFVFGDRLRRDVQVNKANAQMATEQNDVGRRELIWCRRLHLQAKTVKAPEGQFLLHFTDFHWDTSVVRVCDTRFSPLITGIAFQPDFRLEIPGFFCIARKPGTPSRRHVRQLPALRGRLL